MSVNLYSNQKQGLNKMLDTQRRPSLATLQIITPAMASTWLRNNARNRTLSHTLVAEYARAMTEHRWQINGETIKVSSEGRLIDGQHRLQACVESGCEFQSYVIVGLDFDMFDTIDIGKKRTAGDVLGIDGVRNFNATAAAVRWVTLLRSGQFRMSSVKMSADEIRLFLAAEPGIEESTARGLVAKKVMAPGLSGALHYLFSMKDADLADAFFVDLGSGIDLRNGDAVLVLRERLIKDRMSKTKLMAEEIASITIRAWAHRRQRTEMNTTMLRGSYVAVDGKRLFPEIV